MISSILKLFISWNALNSDELEPLIIRKIFYKRGFLNFTIRIVTSEFVN